MIKKHLKAYGVEDENAQMVWFSTRKEAQRKLWEVYGLKIFAVFEDIEAMHKINDKYKKYLPR